VTESVSSEEITFHFRVLDLNRIKRVVILVDKVALGQVSASMSVFLSPYYPISAQYSH